jgi:predicted nucleotidyltransferase
MCKLIEFDNGSYVADIKHKYIANIAQQAKQCSNISRIVLFGSALETRCTERSDIDIAVFGKKKQNEYLRSKEFKNFQRQLFTFGNDFSQDYDILYFCEEKNNTDAILDDINKGTEIYRRAQ